MSRLTDRFSIINSDNEEFLATTNQKFDVVVFDPTFRKYGKFTEKTYYGFIKPKVDSLVNCLTSKAQFISINYEKENVADTAITESGLYLSERIIVPGTQRNKYVGNINIAISIYTGTKSEVINETLPINHHPGYNSINEAMPEHEVELITHKMHKKGCVHFLDAFGGAGTVATVCRRKKDITCTSIEHNPDRCKLIQQRLETEEHLDIGACLICGRYAVAKGFCSRHYKNLHRDRNLQRKVLRGWNEDKIIDYKSLN